MLEVVVTKETDSKKVGRFIASKVLEGEKNVTVYSLLGTIALAQRTVEDARQELIGSEFRLIQPMPTQGNAPDGQEATVIELYVD